MTLLGILLRTGLVSRRSLGGIVAYAVVVGILYATPGPMPDAYVPPAAALVPVTAWLVTSGLAVDTAGTGLLAAAAGGPLRLHAWRSAAAAITAVPLGVGSLLAGWLSTPEAVPGPTVGLALCAHLAAVAIGAGLGAVAAQPVVGDAAITPVVILGGFILVLLAPAASPLGPALDMLGTPQPDETVGWRAVLWLLVAVVEGAALIAVGGLVADRRRAYGTARDL